ncbi:hypothetical protein JCM33374_g5812 [Metschnikowia sp. JCM 33374]|nr:hypothetical protein JCM33374_g5812 [Metschnikowia sp. JCM 33374]
MSSCDPELVRVYLNRLVISLAPADFRSDRVQSLVNDLTIHITRPLSVAPLRSLSRVLEDYRNLFLSRNRADDWRSFQTIIDALTQANSPEDLARHLVYLSRLAPSEPPTNGDHNRLPQSTFETGRGMSSFTSSSHNPLLDTNAAMSELIKPYYSTLDEQSLLASLRHTLVGQDTQVLIFQKDLQSIEIPVSVNTSYTRLLTEILEPALLCKSLRLFLDTVRATRNSPIKTAFLSFVENYLVNYANFIESTFRSGPKSLIDLLDSLDTQTHNLRFLAHLKTRLANLNGFEFLLEVFKLSQFGDSRISEFSTKLFNEISAPYYEYLEHWIIKGELVDENEDFFVSFDINANHINDIIIYNAKKLPTFLKLDDEAFFKMFQLGKTLVFLEKYCKELDWVNDFSQRYFQFIFTSHQGLHSMSSNSIQVLIDRQYDEVIKYFMLVVQSKYSLFSHLLSMKRVMLMESSDFIDAIQSKGAEMFGESALSLTSARLSELLMDSIGSSSLKSLPLNYQRRVDARILDLSHGTIGWDVFTLAYSVPEPPLEALLNYKDQSTQYLRLFNFLWGLRHFQFLLRENFLQFQDYHKNDIRLIKMTFKNSSGPETKLYEKRIKWLTRALRIVCLVRHRMSMLIDAILNFVSFDLIEDSFNVHIVRKIFKRYTSKVPELKKGAFGDAARLSILDSSFLQERNEQLLLTGLRSSTPIYQNTTDLTIDDLTETHKAYLQSVSDCKLLREDARGRHSAKSFVHQIFELLELAYEFLRSSEEFGTTLSNYVNVLRLKSESFDFEEDWDDLHHRLNSVKTYIQTNIYTNKFQPWLKTFAYDMRAEVDLKELSKMI